MSHELRTPLNSSLILAKLLADNKDGNLTDEQVKFAQTISSAGNDLLALINDILDLSKIEAGKVEVTPEPVPLARDGRRRWSRRFEPLAAGEGARVHASTVEPGTPERIETDAQRLGQILKNLLSNALKFTERGEVSLRVSRRPRTARRRSPCATPASASRRTSRRSSSRRSARPTAARTASTAAPGSGLSISRDLARLLGGDITVAERAGRGQRRSRSTLPGRLRGRRAAAPAARRRGAAPAPPPAPADRAAPRAPRQRAAAGAARDRGRPRAPDADARAHPGRRGRRALRRDPARPGARAGLPVRRHAHGRTTALAAAAALSPERASCSTSTCPTTPASACSTSSSAIRRRGTSRCTSLSVADYTQRGARARRGRLRAEAGQARGAGRGVPAARSEALAGPAPRAGGRRRRAAAREHPPAARERRTWRSPASRTRGRGARAAAGDAPSTAW